MRTEHWILLAMNGMLFTGLLLFSLLSDNQNRACRWMLRIACFAVLLWISADLGGIGLNGLNLFVFSCFGTPGYAALAIVSKL
jgi:hypothetical protein